MLKPCKESYLKWKPHCLLSETNIGGQSSPQPKKKKKKKKKSKSPTDKYPNKHHLGIKRFNLCSSLWKIGCLWKPLKESQTWMEIRVESQIRKLQQAKILKWNMNIYSDETEKVQQKWRVQLGETNKKVMAKEGWPKRYRYRTKQYKQNRTFQNNERKFYQQVGREWTKTYQLLDTKEAKTLKQIMGTERS